MAGAMVIRSSTASAGLISAHGVRRRAHRDGSAAPPLDRRVAVEGAEEAPAVVTGWSEAAVFVADLGLLGVLVIADLLSGATPGGRSRSGRGDLVAGLGQQPAHLGGRAVQGRLRGLATV